METIGHGLCNDPQACKDAMKSWISNMSLGCVRTRSLCLINRSTFPSEPCRPVASPTPEDPHPGERGVGLGADRTTSREQDPRLHGMSTASILTLCIH